MKTILQHVRRCRFCKSDMTDDVSAAAFSSNPFCQNCVETRIQNAKSELGSFKVVQDGNYSKIIPTSKTDASSS